MPEKTLAPAPAGKQQPPQQTPTTNSPLPYRHQIFEVAEVTYDGAIFSPLYNSLLLEFGVGKSRMFRSNEVNEFREIMKSTAREVSYSQIDEQANGNQDSILKKTYYSVLAKKEAYKSSKQAVNDIMDEKAKDIIKAVALKKPTVDTMVLNTFAEVNKNQKEEKIVKEFKGKAEKYAKRILPEKKESALTKAKAVVDQVRDDDKQKKANAAGGVQAQTNSSEGSSLVSRVQERSGASEYGKKAYTAVHNLKEKDVYSGFARMGTIINQLVPNDGDSAEASIELVIPVAPLVSIVINFGANAEHDSVDAIDYYNIGAEINVGAQGKISAAFVDAALKGTVGLFIESRGKTVKDALTLISYGLYRKLTNIAPKITPYMWGEGGKTGFSAFEEAEIWAALVEKDMMNDDESSVAIGAQATFSAEVETNKAFKKAKAFSVESEGELKGQIFHEYSKETLQGAGIEHGSQMETNQALLSDPRFQRLLQKNGQQANASSAQPGTPAKSFQEMLVEKRSKFKRDLHHQKKLSLSASTSFNFGDKAGFGCSLEGTITLDNRIGVKSVEASLGISFPEEIDKVKALEGFNNLLPKASDFISTGIGSTINGTGEANANPGVVVGKETALFIINTKLQDHVSNLELDDTPFEEAWGSELSASLNLEYNHEDKETEITLDFSREQSHSFDFEIVNFEVSKSKKISSITLYKG